MGYKASLLELNMSLTKAKGEVKPDVVAHSDMLNHSLAIDCKGGETVKPDQLARYKSMHTDDYRPWIRIYDPTQHTHETCIMDYPQNHNALLGSAAGFPFITLSPQKYLSKSGTFIKEELNRLFEKDIPIPVGMLEPISYYPFSELDHDRAVSKHVVRAVIAILQDKRKRHLDINSDDIFEERDVLKTVHPMYEIMGTHQRVALGKRMLQVFKVLKARYPDWTKQLNNIRASQREGNDAHVAVANLIGLCESIIKEEEDTLGLDDYWK